MKEATITINSTKDFVITMADYIEDRLPFLDYEDIMEICMTDCWLSRLAEKAVWRMMGYSEEEIAKHMKGREYVEICDKENEE